MERVILHSDLNNFYASVECLYNPKFRGKPVAVAGDPKARHGIVLAKSNEAKAFGVMTGEPLWQARQKCPDITFILPHCDLYMKYSELVRQIYADYSDKIEAFGLDECFIDVSESINLFGSGEKIANTLRERIKKELGVTVSVGVSFNKIFAKLGSDMKKPDATTVISKQNFKEKVWCLPVSDLLFVGRSTTKKLIDRGIFTIGQLACTNPESLQTMLGKMGIVLWQYANGYDNSPVSDMGVSAVIKSIGNSTTAHRDIVSEDDARITLMMLSESVSARLREHDFVCETVQLSIRDTDLSWIERQAKLEIPNRTAKSIFELAFSLYMDNNRGNKPVRSLGVRACQLSHMGHIQLSLMSNIADIQKSEDLETAVDTVRNRFGHFCLQRGIMMTDYDLAHLDPKNDHMGILA